MKLSGLWSSMTSRAGVGVQRPRLAAAGLIALVTLLAARLAAHDLMGVAHYDDDERFPGVPVVKMIDLVGEWVIDVVAHPGRPEPGQSTEALVHVYRKSDDAALAVPATLTIERIGNFGSRRATHGPETVVAAAGDGRYVFHPTYPSAANYEVVISFVVDDVDHILRYAYVVGEPGSPWLVVGLAIGGPALLVVLGRIARSRRNLAATPRPGVETP